LEEFVDEGWGASIVWARWVWGLWGGWGSLLWGSSWTGWGLDGG
jgi:hypothetical protein